MSFIDKAKETLRGVPRIIGEETVRVVDYDERQDETDHGQDTKPKAVKKPKVRESKPQPNERTPKSKGVVTAKAGSSKVSADSKSSQQKPKSDLQNSFNLEEKLGFFNKKKKSDVVLDHAAEELSRVEKSKIKDVLEVLDIPETFEIDNHIFLPEDITEIDFDLQAPHGYDMGQVNGYFEQFKISIEYYVKLLKLRNADVAKLATVVDRLQVDLNNQRFDSEIANGINIMPTQDDDDLSNQLMESRLLNMRLREELADLQNGDNLSSDERQKFEDLQDELSIVAREKAELEDVILDMKTRMAYMEEDLSIDSVEDERNRSDNNFAFESDEDDTEKFYEDATLPTFGNDVEELNSEFPSFEYIENDSYENVVKTTSAFFDEEEPLEDFIKANEASYQEDNNESSAEESMIDVLDDNMQFSNGSKIGRRYEEEDDEDDLEAIMRQEFGGQ